MPLEIVGAGFGRTGTTSLALALDQLGAGPCYHMDEVLRDLDRKVAPWVAAAEGRPDWDATFTGYRATCDWPSANYWQPILARYPGAKVILTSRSAESWYDSFAATIAKLVAEPGEQPPQMAAWMDMLGGLLDRAFDGRHTDRAHAIAVFDAYEAEVKARVPADRLLVFRATDGWEPLCRFLGRPIPATPYPRTNDRREFFETVADPG